MFKILASVLVLIISLNSYKAGDVLIAEVGVIAAISLFAGGLDTMIFKKK